MYDDVPTPSINTAWMFPPPLNASTIKAAVYTNHGRPSSSLQSEFPDTFSGYSSDGVEVLMMWAALNMTYSERQDSNSTGGRGFGEFGAYDGLAGNDTWETIVQVGDVITPEWMGSGLDNRSVAINCIVCSRGRENGTIRSACGNYTEKARLVGYSNTTGPRTSATPYTLPNLWSYDEVDNEACGICIFTLSSQDDLPSHDHSIPFPVLQASRSPPYHFNSTIPTGVPDANMQALVPVSVGEQAAGGDGDNPNVGMIVGVVIGVMAFVLLLAAGSWYFWRTKRKTGKKTVQSSSSSTVGRGTGTDAHGELLNADVLRLQTIPAVVRRPDTSHSEVPPAYHEVFKNPNI